MTFIGGDFKVIEPAKTVVATPEQEAAAAAKLARAREMRADRKRKAAEGVSTEPVVIEPTGDAPEPYESVTQANEPERQRMPWHSDGESKRVSTITNVPTEPTNAQELEAWLSAKSVKDPATGEMVHPKELRRREAKRQEAESLERQAEAEPSGKSGYLNAVADDAEYQAAKLAYDQAEAQLRALQTEQAAFTGKMQDAIASQDLDAIKSLRARNRELPDLIFAARMGASTLKLTYYQMRAARARVVKREARAAASKVNADFQEWQAKVNEAQNAALTASYESDDAVRDVGAILRELDQLKAEALAAAIGPQAHRAPTGMVEYGADTSYMSPMPQPGLERQ